MINFRISEIIFQDIMYIISTYFRKNVKTICKVNRI